MLTSAGLTITPMNPARLSTVERDVLYEWALYWRDRTSPKPATTPDAPAKPLTMADLAEFNARGGGS